jgi:DNA topoisomerase II
MSTNKKTIPIDTFFDCDYRDFSQYDNYRKIPSVVDGLKPSARKVMYTVIKTNVSSNLKVSQLGSRTAELTNYLHGEESLNGVIVGLCRDFTGANNITLLQRDGNFGTRLSPDASAARYIKTCKEPYLDSILHPMDTPILKQQIFEGDEIEPAFFVPILPLSILNNNEGLSIGFASKILPRNVDDVIQYIISKLDGKNPRRKLNPYFKGFNGTVVEVEKNKFEIIGRWQKTKRGSKILIDEVPVRYTRKQYEKELIKLEDDNIIKDFKDMSDDESFLFEVTVSREFLAQSDEKITDVLGLRDKFTENLTFEDENTKIVKYDDVRQVIDKFMDIRLHYYDKRKLYMIEQLSNKIKTNLSKYTFCKGVVEEKIIINKKAKLEIEKQLDAFKDIERDKEGSFDYILRMPIYSLSKEKFMELLATIKEMAKELQFLKNRPVQDMWVEDIKNLKSALQKYKKDV